ncbi:MAG TPA: hypothetical protein VEB59_13760 [Gemmatimonadales bacterium]|nr:hypothetical protein [Gemmatimonadales bacterium]
MAALLSVLAPVAPGCSAGRGDDPCREYRPQEAKRTFDGRVGVVLVMNAGRKTAEVKAYHPDAGGNVERRWSVAPGKLLALDGDDGARLSLGNDWGFQVDGSCVRTLGEAAAWNPGEFTLTWTGDSLRAGISPAR